MTLLERVTDLLGDYQTMEAFVTGSRVYGTPREDSDIDLVICVSKEDAELLWSMMEDPKKGLRFGRLNLIVTVIDCASEWKYKVWKETTNKLKATKPVTRDVAVSAFKEAGVSSYLEES